MNVIMVTINDRTDVVLTSIADGRTAVEYINNAVLDEFLPVYSTQLRAEALRLLDMIKDNPEHRTGIATETAIREVLTNGLLWLRSHHVKKAAVLTKLASFFVQSSSGSVDVSTLPAAARDEMKRIHNKVMIADPCYQDEKEGVGQLATAVLKNWYKMWDNDDSYRSLISMVKYEHLVKNISLVDTIRILQAFETTFILEQVDR